MSYTLIIPARLGSTRLAKKMLAPIDGKPLIQYTYSNAAKSGAKRVVIATDHEAIASVAKGFGAEVVMTPESCPTGTDRVAVTATLLGLPDDELVVNLQGDEPLLPAVLFDQVAALFQKKNAEMATLIEPLHSDEDFANPMIVKAVTDAEGYAMYFSRAPIPYHRESHGITRFKHMGIYAYSVGFLKWLSAQEPTLLERTEMLEQLRVLFYGKRIATEAAVAKHLRSVDTMDDLVWVREYVAQHASAVIV